MNTRCSLLGIDPARCRINSDTPQIPTPPLSWGPPAGPTLHEQQAADAAWQTHLAAQQRAVTIGRRRAHDKTAICLAVVFCATLVVPWILGHFLIHDTLYPPSQPRVYDTAIRGVGQDFVVDWATGSVGILGAAAVFVLVRPWPGRRRSLIAAMLLVVVVVAGLIPYSRAQWTEQENVTASRLRNSVYPIPGYLTCGQTSVSFGTSPTESGRPKVTYTLYIIRKSTAATNCTQLELWEGWRKVKQVNLLKKQSVKPDAPIAVTKKKPAEKTVFTVRLASGKTVKYALPQLLR